MSAYAFAKEHEIVPQALRQRLGRRTARDRTATRIMVEFPITLPRDRELIRQLTFVARGDGEEPRLLPLVTNEDRERGGNA